MWASHHHSNGPNIVTNSGGGWIIQKISRGEICVAKKWKQKLNKFGFSQSKDFCFRSDTSVCFIWKYFSKLCEFSVLLYHPLQPQSSYAQTILFHHLNWIFLQSRNKFSTDRQTDKSLTQYLGWCVFCLDEICYLP